MVEGCSASFTSFQKQSCPILADPKRCGTQLDALAAGPPVNALRVERVNRKRPLVPLTCAHTTPISPLSRHPLTLSKDDVPRTLSYMRPSLLDTRRTWRVEQALLL